MYAKRMNKTYEINTPQEKQAYLARGFDIFDDEDELMESSPQKTIAFGEYQKLRAASEAMHKELYTVRAENNRLLAQLAVLQAGLPSPGLTAPLTPDPTPQSTPSFIDPMPELPDAAAPELPDEEIKTLRPVEDAPKMGKKK